MPPLTRVAVLDDRPLYREGIGSLLREAGFSVTADGVADDGPDVVVLGVTTRPVPIGATIVRLSEGASAELIAAVERAGQRNSRGDDAVVAPRLTPRERTVLAAVRSGQSAGDIARALGISERTVERHKQVVLDKLGVRSQAQAVVHGLQWGLLRAD